MKLTTAFRLPEIKVPYKIITAILDCPRWLKRAVAVFVDGLLCIFTLWLAFSFRLNTWGFLEGIQLVTILASLVIALPIFIMHGLYRAIFRFIGWSAFMAIFRAILIYGIIFATFFTVISIPGIPRTVGILQPMLLLLMVAISRLAVRQLLGGTYRGILQRNELPRVLIYGTGSVGRQIASALRNGGEFLIAGYLDDDAKFQGAVIDGFRVYRPDSLKEVVQKLGVKTILLATPNMEPERRKEIIANLRGANVAVRNVPNVSQLAGGQIRSSDLQELTVEDLLGRPAVPPDAVLLNRNIRGKCVMVTGAGGSIGSELCRQICSIGPSKLILFELSEYALYSIHSELSEYACADFDIIPLFGSVRDRQRMQEVISVFRPHTIYHAAAYKHVPLVEQNLAEGISNNVMGTLTAASLAAENGVESFVLISTDKAVRPSNVMGASKRIAELILQAYAARKTDTIFSMVRFGNVLGSSGSVVPLFKKQIAEGGPITLTHPDVTRYFMTIPEAAQLVLQAGAMAGGGDVFVLDMGESVKIMDLARVMVELSGLTIKSVDNPTGDIELAITGLRPAEKLYEELLLGNNPQPTLHPRIMTAQEEFFPWPVLEEKIIRLGEAIEVRDYQAIKSMLSDLVVEYAESLEFFDPLVSTTVGSVYSNINRVENVSE